VLYLVRRPDHLRRSLSFPFLTNTIQPISNESHETIPSHLKAYTSHINFPTWYLTTTDLDVRYRQAQTTLNLPTRKKAVHTLYRKSNKQDRKRTLRLFTRSLFSVQPPPGKAVKREWIVWVRKRFETRRNRLGALIRGELDGVGEEGKGKERKVIKTASRTWETMVERYNTMTNESGRWWVNKFRVYFTGEVQSSSLNIYTYFTTVLVPKVVNKIDLLGELKRARRLGEIYRIRQSII